MNRLSHSLLLAIACHASVAGCGGANVVVTDEWAHVGLSEGGKTEIAAPSARRSRGMPWAPAMERIARGLASGQRTGKPLRVAVLDFTTTTQAECGLGAPVAEGITTGVFHSRKFQVLERRLLDKVLEENRMTQSDLYDPKQVARLGHLAGLDALVLGTIQATDASYEIKARLVAAESSVWLAAGDVLLDRSEAEQRGRCRGPVATNTIALPAPEARALAEAPTQGTSQGAPPGPRARFYFEDFGRVRDGEIPNGWNAGNRLLVTGSGRERALQLTSGQGKDTAVVSGISFPENFRIEMLISRHYQETLMLQSGDLRFGVHWMSVYLGAEERRADIDGDLMHVVAVEKRGNVVKLYVDGQEQIVVRAPEFSAADMLNINMEGKARLYSIKGTAL